METPIPGINLVPFLINSHLNLFLQMILLNEKISAFSNAITFFYVFYITFLRIILDFQLNLNVKMTFYLIAKFHLTLLKIRHLWLLRRANMFIHRHLMFAIPLPYETPVTYISNFTSHKVKC